MSQAASTPSHPAPIAPAAGPTPRPATRFLANAGAGASASRRSSLSLPTYAAAYPLAFAPSDKGAVTEGGRADGAATDDAEMADTDTVVLPGGRQAAAARNATTPRAQAPAPPQPPPSSHRPSQSHGRSALRRESLGASQATADAGPGATAAAAPSSATDLSPSAIRETLNEVMAQLVPDDAVACLSEIGHLVVQTSGARVKRLDETRGLLLALSHAVDAAQQEVAALDVDTARSQHAQRVQAWESELVQTQQQHDAAHGEAQRLQERALQLEEELRRLDHEIHAYDETPSESHQIQLTLYRALDISFLPDAQGELNKCLVRSASRNDVQSVTFDEHHSRFFYANLLWDMAM
ncbi:hypothetical protein CXG81DRAFT_28258 [Caulochytrium protostelioides]|uniref:Kinetochore protein Spc24 n=1 Tax=Caulochytrium protostelioides TaxID=1555241 RepID=A0A4P9X1I9_9FUNG|nr:hypothetical protein CXG81DRAFT_28258 [Caulochytrium protostelioides]|eukprot:RKO98955.1 hypothetical protein CXG81DRAFT_28258 [Caulochytrium protostelioides]